MQKIIAVAALLGNLSAAETAAWSEDLRCGGCINSGFNFCVQAEGWADIEVGATPPATKCCQDATCSEFTSDLGWSCSYEFGDPSQGDDNREMALTMCPFRKDHCGPKKEFTPDTAGAETMEINVMDPGETCSYVIRTACGGPQADLAGNAETSIQVVQATDFDGEPTPEPVDEPATQGKPPPGGQQPGGQKPGGQQPGGQQPGGQQPGGQQPGGAQQLVSGLISKVRTTRPTLEQVKEKRKEIPFDLTAEEIGQINDYAVELLGTTPNKQQFAQAMRQWAAASGKQIRPIRKPKSDLSTPKADRKERPVREGGPPKNMRPSDDKRSLNSPLVKFPKARGALKAAFRDGGILPGEARCKRRELQVTVTRDPTSTPAVQGSRPIVMQSASYFQGSVSAIELAAVPTSEQVAAVAATQGATALKFAAAGLALVGASLY